MRFTVLINRRICISGLTFGEAKRAATWYANRCTGCTVSVGVQ